ncbi:MAG: hypothetical protein GX275_03170 [Clostridiales bacterium]|nr:hypothetical protein [Clostridiales bacterium]
MKEKKGIIRIILLVILIVICAGLYAINFNSKKQGLIVTEWDNIYDENNINIFYENIEENSKDNELNKLNNTYKITEIVNAEQNEIDKILKTTEILNTIVEFDDIEDSGLNSGYEILMDLNGRKKVSDRDMAIIERDLILSAGYTSRIGELRKNNPQFEIKPSYYVVEYYSPESNKWIMIDFKEKAYLKNSEGYLNTIDFINANKESITYNGKRDLNTYYKEIKKYLSSYTIPIDNTLTMLKSNSYLTYCSNDKDVDLKKNNVFIGPTIFTKNKDVMNIEPNHEYVEGKDEKAYLILQKRQDDVKDDYTYTIGAFKDGTTINDYYLGINGDINKITDKYKEIKLQKGINTIELSLDGNEIVSKVIINRQK